MAKDRGKKKKEKNEKPPPLRSAWLRIMPPSTKGDANVHKRLYWKGVPNDAADPLRIAGMELCVGWSPVENDRRQEMVVSAITIEEFLAHYPHPASTRYRLYDYKVQLLQLIDANSAYGKLLAQQQFKGIKEEGGDITARVFRMRLIVGEPDRASRDAFASRTRGSSFPNGVILPGFTILSTPILVEESVELDEHGIPVDGQAVETSVPLSDLEVDRCWELTGMVAEWLLDREGNVKKRERRRTEAFLRRDEAKAEQQRKEARVAEIAEELAKAVSQQEELNKRLAKANADFKAAKDQYVAELGRAKSAERTAENEIGRHRGVYNQEFKRLTDAYRAHGEDSEQFRTAQKKASEAKARLDAAPAALEAAKQKIPPIETRWRGVERTLGGPVLYVIQQLQTLNLEVARLSEAKVEAERVLKEAQAVAILMSVEADDYK